MTVKRSFITILFIPLFLLSRTSCQKKPEKIKIGIVNMAIDLEDMVEGIKKSMTELGYVEDLEIIYLYDGPLGRMEAVDPVIDKILEEKPDMIFSLTTPVTIQVKEAVEGTDIPVAFGPVGTPVDSGIVKSLREPGGNITGIQARSFGMKGLEWFIKIVPDLKNLYIPFNPDDKSMAFQIPILRETASDNNIELYEVTFNSWEEMPEILNQIPEDVEAIWQLASPFWAPYFDELIQAALYHKKPLMSHESEWVEGGALVSFGLDGEAMGRQASRLAHKILQGMSQADLPVEQAEYFLSINLKTAEALELKIPGSVLRQADNIIR